MIHTVQGLGIVNKAKVDVFLELSWNAHVFLKLSCFYNDPINVGNLISGSSTFSKSSLNIWKFSVHVLLKPDLENFEHCFASVCDEFNAKFNPLALSFFGIGMKTDLC